MSPYEKLEWLHSQLSQVVNEGGCAVGYDFASMLEVVEDLREPYLKKRAKDDEDYPWSEKNLEESNYLTIKEFIGKP